MARMLWFGLLAWQALAQPLTVYLAPNTHGTVSGWLVDFDSERSHVVNNYLSHMDRVAADPDYAMAFSEVPNLMVLMQFAPQRMAQLQQQVREGRLELVNGFFLEPTINLSGGEALVQMGVLGLGWYDEVFGRRPRFSWMIDACGTHRQMPQIVSGLGLEALFFSRNNPAPKSTFWWKAPDGSRTLAVCLGRGYSSTSQIFKTGAPLGAEQMAALRLYFEQERAASPSPDKIFVAVGGGDYSLAPKRATYPSELLQAWARQYPDVRLRFTVPGEYVDAIRKDVLPEYAGDTAHSYNAFWMNMPEVKRSYRHAEHALAAAEMLATAASLGRGPAYPSVPLYHSWVLMLMNMDRNILWGAGAGAPFYDPQHWNAQDRFDFVERHAAEITAASLDALTAPGEGTVIFNPLSWDRDDPVEIGGRLCAVRQPAMGIAAIRMGGAPREAAFEERVETPHYVVRFDRRTGALLSIRSGNREFLGGPANQVMVESVAGIVKDPANWMAARPHRKLVDSSGSHAVAWRVLRGPLATTLEARSELAGGSSLERRVTLYRDFPRIDFETTVDLHTPDVLVTVDFPLGGMVVERTRGIPYGFATVDPRRVPAPADFFIGYDHKQYGFTDAVAPAVRWSDYGFAEGGGMGLLDRGLACHELNGNTVTLALLNAQSSYRKLPNTILAGQGRRTFAYALWPHTGTWQQARIPQHAWEYNTPAITRAGRRPARAASLVRTSPNLIVEAVRRVAGDIEIRMVEAAGAAGQGEITVNLPHTGARLTNLMGEHPLKLAGKGGVYGFPVLPQQIVTLRLGAGSTIPPAPAIRAWDPVVPPAKRAALHQYKDLKGYPGEPPQ